MAKRGRPTAFKTHLLRFRGEHNITRANLARALGVPYRTLEDWEAGRRTPSPSTQRLILGDLWTRWSDYAARQSLLLIGGSDFNSTARTAFTRPRNRA